MEAELFSKAVERTTAEAILGKYTSQVAFRNMIEHLKVISSLSIQSAIKSIIFARKAKGAYFKKQIRNKLRHAICVIQARYRGHIIRRKVAAQALRKRITFLRSFASTIIQKNYKRYKTQQMYTSMLNLERLHASIKWVLPASTVRVIGTFTKKEWET